MRSGPDVSLGEVWNILASLVVRRRRLRQAGGCRSFFLSLAILGNDNVLYHSLPGLASQQHVLGHLSEMLLKTTFVNTCRLVITDSCAG